MKLANAFPATLLGLLAIVHLAAAQAAPMPVLLCVTCRVDREPNTMHAEYAARYYASEFPRLSVSTKLVGIYEPGGTTQRGLIRAKVANGSNCDVVIGPGSSGIAVAMNPLVDQLWMDYSATSTELSSRFNFPLFNRVVPTDQDATNGWAPLLSAFNWGTFGIICTDTAYGRSVTSGMSAMSSRLKGSVGAISCVQIDAGADQAVAEVQRVLASGIRVVSVGLDSSDPFFEPLVAAIIAAKAYTRISFIFAESACSSTSQRWARIPGAFCATFAVQPSVIDPFFASYLSRDMTFVRNSYVDLGWPLSQVSFDSTGVYPAYAVDATRFALRALDDYVRLHGPTLPSVSAITAFVRNFTMRDGVSGFIEIPTGDRAASDMVVYNADHNGSLKVIANTTAAGNVTIAPFFSAFGRDDMTLAEVPPSVSPAVAAEGSDMSTLIIVVIVVVVVLVAAAGGLFAATRPPPGRDNAIAPKNEKDPFTVIFTDIQSSTSQWAENAAVMGEAVDLHHELIRRVLRLHRGYEVKTIGDSFMAAFEDPVDALKCSLAIQEELFAASWPSCIDELYMRKAREQCITDVQPIDGSYGELWSGIRVRVGMHTGMGNIKLDPVSQGYDYYGTVVNTAARVEGVGHGGQILLTDAAFDAVRASEEGRTFLDNKTSIIDLGPQPLRGLAEPVALLQVMPIEFSERGFPPLRLDVEVLVEDADDSDDDTKSYSAHSAASAYTAASGGSSGGIASRVPRDAPEWACKKAAKRLKGQADFASMVFQYHVVKALFSTVPLKERSKFVFDLADKWRVTEAKSLKPSSSASAEDKEKATDRVIAYLATKTAPVAAAYVSPYVAPPPPVFQPEASASANSAGAGMGHLAAGSMRRNLGPGAGRGSMMIRATSSSIAARSPRADSSTAGGDPSAKYAAPLTKDGSLSPRALKKQQPPATAPHVPEQHGTEEMQVKPVQSQDPGQVDAVVIEGISMHGGVGDDMVMSDASGSRPASPEA